MKGLWQCAYCASDPIPSAKVRPGEISHGICAECSPKLDEAYARGEQAIKKCPDCVRNIGSWLERCGQCAKEKVHVS